MSETDWWKTMFDDKYLDTYLHTLTPERTTSEVDYIINAAQLDPSETILDLACGHGRHAIELSRRGYSQITGLDYSGTFIDKAIADAEQAGANIHFMLGDMKDLPFDGQFDTVLLLFTAFGYFDDETNRSVLKQVNKTLKPGGKFFIDVMSAEAASERFTTQGILDEATGTLRIDRQADMGDHVVDESEWYDTDKQIVHSHREWQDNGEKKEYDFWLHVYTKSQYQEMLSEAGFEVVSIDAEDDYKERPANAPAKNRTAILAKKIS